MTVTVTSPFRVFQVRLQQVQWLSPHFRRVTFTGPDLDSFADNGFDQRIKLVLPLPDHGMAYLPDGPDWYTQWRALPDHQRNPLRTYTVRAVRPDRYELDVDMVFHGETGPACRWLANARVGDELAVVGPDARYPGEHGGVEFRPPAGVQTVLLAGDETAVPAVLNILERLPAGLSGQALLEVPDPADALPLTAANLPVRWLAREGQPPGAQLVPAVREAAARLFADSARQIDEREELATESEDSVLWEVPDPSGAVGSGGYAWLAGEAGVIRTLRRHLVSEVGLDRRQVAFMGYWRLGRAEHG
jgi:NADPH-dependent ferric siderophore reductase